MTRTTVWLLVIALLIGVTAGWVGANYFKSSQPIQRTSTTVTATADTKAADFRVLINSLEKEQVTLVAGAARRGFDGDPDYKEASDALDANAKAYAATIGSVYGKDNETKFLNIRRSYNTFFSNYTNALKANDKAKIEKEVANITSYVDATSDFYSKVNSGISREAIRSLIAENAGVIKASIDAYAKKDFGGSYTWQRDAASASGKVADLIAEAIIKQKPELF